MSKVDYLTEDSLFPSEQKYVCISFLTPPKDDKVKPKNKKHTNITKKKTIKTRYQLVLKLFGCFNINLKKVCQGNRM